MKVFIFLLIFNYFLISFCLSRSSREIKDEVDHILGDNYDKTIPPLVDSKPVDVGVNISILSLRAVNEQELFFTADLFVHYLWKDPRLNISSDEPIRFTLNKEFGDQIWKPDTVFKNGIKGEFASHLYSTVYFIVNEKKEIFQASRITLDILCDFNFRNFPHDVNSCPIDLMALSYQKSIMNLNLENFFLSKHLFNKEFHITKDINNRSKCKDKNDFGRFSCIRTTIKLTRNFGRFMIQTYIPSCVIVITTFFGFWFSPETFSTRMALYMSALIALFTMQIHTLSTIKPSYIISIVIWMTSCICFVFICIIFSVFGMIIEQRIKKIKKQQNIKPVSYIRSISEENFDINLVRMHRMNQVTMVNTVKNIEFKKKTGLNKYLSKFKNFLVFKGITGASIDNFSKKFVSSLFIVWLLIYYSLISFDLLNKI